MKIPGLQDKHSTLKTTRTPIRLSWRSREPWQRGLPKTTALLPYYRPYPREGGSTRGVGPPQSQGWRSYLSGPQRTGGTGPPGPDTASRQRPQLWEAPQLPRTVGPDAGWTGRGALPSPPALISPLLTQEPPMGTGPRHLHLTLWGKLGAGQRCDCHRRSGNTEDARAEEMSPGSCYRQGVYAIGTRQNRLLCPPAPLSAKCRPRRMPGSRQAQLRLQCH